MKAKKAFFVLKIRMAFASRIVLNFDRRRVCYIHWNWPTAQVSSRDFHMCITSLCEFLTFIFKRSIAFLQLMHKRTIPGGEQFSNEVSRNSNRLFANWSLPQMLFGMLVLQRNIKAIDGNSGNVALLCAAKFEKLCTGFQNYKKKCDKQPRKHKNTLVNCRYYEKKKTQLMALADSMNWKKKVKRATTFSHPLVACFIYAFVQCFKAFTPISYLFSV